jgi:predicted nucleotidyltransferase
MSLNLREFIEKYKPPREIFANAIPTTQLNTYIYNDVYMSLTRAIKLSEISVVWLIRNNHDPKDKIDIATLIHPKNRESLVRLSHF